MISSCISFYCDIERDLSGEYGLGYFIFLKLLSGIDKELGEKLHDSKGKKRLAVSNVFTSKTDKRVKFIRVSSLDDENIKILLKYAFIICNDINVNFRGKDTKFQLKDIKIIESRDVIVIDEKEVWEKISIKDTKKITICFLSPTTFKRQRVYNPLPDIYSLFNSIKMFSDSSILKERKKEDYYDIIISRFSLNTEVARIHGIPFVGAKGEIVFDLKHLDVDFKREIMYLSCLSYFSGVGAKTSMGMGQVLPLFDGKHIVDFLRR